MKLSVPIRGSEWLVLAVSLGMPLSGSAAPGQSWAAARHHWAYQPVQAPTPPAVQAADRVQSPMDAFLLEKLEAKGLTSAPPADPRTLLRRVYYDLIGLPPTFAEIQAFERDPSAAAYRNVVERLLASPRYGERWGRHWLDVARYADTKDLVLAYGKDALRPYAYTYRDYVIRAFNEDLPFDQFVQDQLAADLVRPNLPRWRLAALGFLTLGRLFDNNVNDQIDDQIDTTTRGFLGLTVACARCHDHKYDAIAQKDYYGLYGVFASTERPYDLPLLEEPAQVPGGLQFEQQLARARQELDKLIDTQFTQLTETFRQRLGDYLVRAATTPPDITETAQFALSLTPEDFRPALMQRTRRWLAQHAKPDDRLFGLWAVLMGLPEQGFEAAATARVAKAVRQCAAGAATARGREDSARAPDFNPLVVRALRQATLTNQAAVARAYGQLLEQVYAVSKKTADLTSDQRELLDIVIGESGPLWFPRRDTPDHMSRPEKDRYGGLVANLDKLAANAVQPPPARAMVVADLSEPYAPHIFIRGNPSRLGEAVPRAFLRVLSGGEPPPFVHGSGRLELAHAITATTNPLTARVFVNRVWMLHFGQPLVATTTDFGARSEPPTHPELLDWLASDFMRSGWSIKHLHRGILLSRAYQQASSIPHSAFRTPHSMADADNRLLSRYPRRRLDFEAMRDSLLFISGRLDTILGGRSVELAADPLNRRRTIYGLINRQDLPAMYRAFDFPAPDQCVERRPHTTVPQQGLFALNSPFVIEQARALAARPEIRDVADPAARADALYCRVLGRHPTATETERVLRFIEQAEIETESDGPIEVLSEEGLTAWEQLAQVLLISNEALFLD